MPAIIKDELRVLNSDSFKYTISNNPTYVFISGTTQWTNEFRPPTPVDSTKDENFCLSDILGVKRILPNDVVSVIPRTDWYDGTVYDQYDHEIDLVNTKNPITGDFYRFYVVTDDFNVYKCLSNSSRGASVYRPTGTSPEPIKMPDGYVWKYMYTIQSADAFKFMTENWIPCYTLTYNDSSTQWNSQQSAIPGTVDSINMVTKGSGYSAVRPPTVTITGDGSGAVATAIVSPSTGEVIRIEVSNNGSDYTNATVTISDDLGVGVGATARALISPRQGHGYDPRVELGASYIMVKITLEGEEGGLLPTGLDYRTSGIIHLPGTNSSGLSIKVPDGRSRLFSVGDEITGGTSGTTADVVYVNYQQDLVQVNNINGTFSQAETISTNLNNVSQIQSISSMFIPITNIVSNANNYNINSGRVLYISNREKITRVGDQKENIISVISF